ncbi:MAG TPA: nucleoside diphosphate kinase regulator, partial [bacterium]|nr:nucleoside diphosphate kinase regulator [bacterium]
DLARLTKLLQESEATAYRGSEYLAKLSAELARAKVVAAEEISNKVITMHSQVCLEDLETGDRETYTLVFPEEADVDQRRISILAPIGTAMLGYEVGDVFEWEVPAGKRNLQVKEILYQPEAAGDYHL